MYDFAQLDLASCIKIFPNLKFIGGAVGHRLDIHAGCVKSKSIRITLAGKGVLALEQVVIYGRRSPTDKLENISRLTGNLASQSSTRASQEESKADNYGAVKAVNGVLNGYDRSETNFEELPYWEVLFPEEFYIETIHVSNFCVSGYAEKHSDIIIEYIQDGVWHPIYKRSAPHVLNAKLKKTICTLEQLTGLPSFNKRQQEALDFISKSVKLLRTDASNIDIDFSDKLLDCVDAFLPLSLEPGGREYQFRDLADISRIRVTGIDTTFVLPQIEVESICPHSKQFLYKKEKTDSIDLQAPRYISALKISFENSEHIFTANAFRIEVNENSTTGEVDAHEWKTIYDNTKIASICKDVAWVAYLAGNQSARCIGLVAKPSIMMRRSNTEQTEAYMWCRLNLHGKTPEFKSTVASIVNSANEYDTRTSRLKFGRHSFSTCLGDRNQLAYVKSIESTLKILGENSIDAMLLYGTLLGAVRDGTFISHDDDVDIGYVSCAKNDEELLAERNSIIKLFQSHNYNVSADTSHLTFSVSHKENPQPYWVEIFPIWNDPINSENLKMYMNLMTVRSVPKAFIGSVKDRSYVSLNGARLPAPANPDQFLALRYGPQWKTPDPFFEI